MVYEGEVEGSNLFQVTDDRCLELSGSEGSEGVYGTSFFKVFCLMSKIKGSIPWHWITLDTGYSASIFKTKSLLEGISKTDKTLRLITNAGVISSKSKVKHADLSVWHNPRLITSILELTRVAEKLSMVMDTK